MNVSSQAFSNLSPALQQAARLHAQASDFVDPYNPRDWDISVHAFARVRAWQLPETAALAALSLPLIQAKKIEALNLHDTFGARAVSLARTALRWQADLLAHTANADREAQSGAHSYLLRSLLRQIYIDYPDFQAVLLFLAIHDGLIAGQVDKRMAETTLNILVPLLDMLGLWSLRQDWIEKCMLVRAKEDEKANAALAHIRKLKRRLQWEHPGEAQALIEEKTRQLHLKNPDTHWLKQNAKLLERSEAFLSLRDTLIRRARSSGINENPDICLRTLRPGEMLLRAMEGKSPEEILGQLWVHVFCPSEAQCYQMLGIIHSLGKPIDPRFSERFEDFLGQAQPNGFRLLRTALVYRPASFDDSVDYQGSILVEFRILTHQNHAINLWGVIEAFYKKPSTYLEDSRYDPAWWSPSQIKNLLEQINHRARETTHNLTTTRNGYASVGEFLQEREFNTRSELLYIFTPKGQIILMENGSTALDFAYQIHTELGNHAGHIEVNGQPVHYGYHLKNGDMVHIQYEPLFQGPDFSWLSFVSTRKARQCIRSRLAQPSSSLHPGRELIQKQLVKTLNYYRKSKGYRLHLTGRQIDTFLKGYAQSRGFGDLESFYEAIVPRRKSGQQIAPAQIVHLLISAELSKALVDYYGNPLPHPIYRIKLCDGCRPVPGEALIAFEQGPAGSERVAVHTGSCQFINEESTSRRSISVQWSESTLDEEPVYAVLIYGEDRSRLVVDILECVHTTHSCYLQSIEAHVHENGIASLQLTISGATSSMMSTLQSRIEDVPGVRQVWAEPEPRYKSAAFAPRADASTGYNPYLESESYERTGFYDREGQVSQILKWLRNPQAGACIILHGQRRVGKTSLAKHLSITVLNEQRIVFPVYIDMKGLSGPSSLDVANYLLDEICRQARTPMPLGRDMYAPMTWLRRGIETTSQELGLPLFVILDEFDTLIARELEGYLEAQVMANLTYALTSLPAARWMPVISETLYHESGLPESVVALLLRTESIELAALDYRYAYRLIQEPAERHGLRYTEPGFARTGTGKRDSPGVSPGQQPIIEQIYTLSGGIPYYIKRICYHIVDRVRRQARTNITQEDLNAGIRDLLRYGERYFDHFLRPAGYARWLTLAAIANTSAEDGWASLEAVFEYVRASPPGLSKENTLNMIHLLERQGLIRLDGSSLTGKAQIPVRIFAHWARENLYPETALNPTGVA